MNTNIGYIISGNGNVTLIANDKTYNITTDHSNYLDIIKELKLKNYDNVIKLIDINDKIQTYINSTGEDISINISDGIVYYNGEPVHNSLTSRIIQMMDIGYDINPMIQFFKNIMENPSNRAVEEAFTFLEKNSLPITEDGCFLAYKRVNDDYTDTYTGTIMNNIGAKHKMPRNMVSDNKEDTGSSGYHVCSLCYLAHYCRGQGRIMICKVNPKDIVSVPIDYDNSKLRCCEYIVVAEHVSDKNDEPIPELFDKPVYTATGSEYGIKPNGDHYHNIRNRDGKFTKKS